MHWWMYLAYSPADDVASTLAAMAKVGLAVGSLGTASKGYHPQACLGAFVSTDYCPAAIYDGAIDFCERHGASRIAHCDNGEKGVGCEAGDDVGCSCAGWEIWQI